MILLSRPAKPFKNSSVYRSLTNLTTSTVQDCHSYLAHCNKNDLSIQSTLFKGTLYELAAKNFLEKTLHCKNLIRTGGTYDNGVDIIGQWNLNHFWKQSIENFSSKMKKNCKQLEGSILKNSIEYNQYKNTTVSNKKLVSLSEDINIFVQCKNYDTKIKASTIRELTGIYHFHIRKKKDLSRNFMFLISPHNLTKQAQVQMDSMKIPVIHCKLSKLVFNNSGNVYDARCWEGSKLESIYLNPLSRDFLNGLNIELQFEIIKHNAAIE